MIALRLIQLRAYPKTFLQLGYFFPTVGSGIGSKYKNSIKIPGASAFDGAPATRQAKGLKFERQFPCGIHAIEFRRLL